MADKNSRVETVLPVLIYIGSVNRLGEKVRAQSYEYNRDYGISHTITSENIFKKTTKINLPAQI